MESQGPTEDGGPLELSNKNPIPKDKLIALLEQQLSKKGVKIDDTNTAFITYSDEMLSLRNRQTLTISMHTSYQTISDLRNVIDSVLQSVHKSDAVKIDSHFRYYDAAVVYQERFHLFRSKCIPEIAAKSE
ncbi:hypothetical protein HK102_006706, partial [Quaeritorhiza haematococci]